MTDFQTPNFSVDLKDQVALVTGASSGLGYRFSKVLEGRGAKVAIAATSPKMRSAILRSASDMANA